MGPEIEPGRVIYGVQMECINVVRSNESEAISTIKTFSRRNYIFQESGPITPEIYLKLGQTRSELQKLRAQAFSITAQDS